MPATALRHFENDIARARALVEHARTLSAATHQERLFKADVLRSGWMFAVGAFDAYFCDAYSFVVGSTLVAKSRQRTIPLPTKLLDITVPIAATLAEYQVRENWRWRIAARRMMDDRNMLNLGGIKMLFNPFLPSGQKLFRDVVHTWMTVTRAKSRLFGIIQPGMRVPRLGRNAAEHEDGLKRRFDVIIQRRHDCIHNCDRPKVAIQTLDNPNTVRNVISDVSFLVQGFDAHLRTNFPVFLSSLGFSSAVVDSVID